jgi:hypothetical protein
MGLHRSALPAPARPATSASVSARARSRSGLGGVALLVALGALGCAGDGTTSGGGSGGGGDADFAAVQREVFDRSCTSASCHASATRAGGLSLEASDSYDSLVDVEPDNGVARAAGLLRVVPGDPESSFLVRKITSDLAPGEGSPMPLGMSPLAPADIELVRSWIAEGALPVGAGEE